MILIFSGREHHKKKLQPIYDALVNRDAHWLICNNAINIDPPLLYMNASGQKFVHSYMQFKPDDDKLVDRIVEKTLNDLPFLPGVSPFWHTYSVREAAENIVSFRNVIEQAKAVLILHSNNFFAKSLAYVASEKNIPVFAFQEGILRDRDQETMNKQLSAVDYVAKLFVWSNTAKKQYIKAGVKASDLVVSGPIHLDKYVNMSQETALARTGQSQPTVLFVPTIQSEYIGNIFQDANYLHKIAVSLGFNFIFRPHPFELEANVYGDLLTRLNTFNAPDNLTLCRNGNTVVIGQHSTIMYEALALGAVVIEYQEGGKDILQPLAPLAISAKKEDIQNTLVNIVDKINTLDNKKINKFIQDEFGENLGRATDTVVREIEKAL